MKQKYIKLICTSYFFIFSVLIVQSQNSNSFWSPISKANTNLNKGLKVHKKEKVNYFQLNFNEFNRKLMAITNTSTSKGKIELVIEFPNSKGELESYLVTETSVFSDELQQKHPNIRSFSGVNTINNSIVNFSLSPIGLNAMFLHTSVGTVFLDPIASGNTQDYKVFAKKDLPQTGRKFKCGVEERIDVAGFDKKTTKSNFILNDGNLRTFRLALACTGEYAQFHLTQQGVDAGETDAVKKAAVLAAMNNTMTRVNGIFKNELAVTMEIVSNNEDIMFLDGTTDPFTDDDSTILIDESQTVIDANIGTAFYDIGHTFGKGLGGGLAQSPSACWTGKARGVTGSNVPIGDSFNVGLVSHEIGHQFGASHTFNSNNAGNCDADNRADATAVETGSGTTIMSYAGICSPENVQNFSDSYFHNVSLDQMWANINSGVSTCAELSSSGNFTPTITPLSNFTIPKSTPFVLNGNGDDADGNGSLTYAWEQKNTEVATIPLVSTATGGPAFRSLIPSSSPDRFMPEIETVIAGSTASIWEVVPSVARSMVFALTVRDNDSRGGRYATKSLTVTTDGASGPFAVTSQNSIGESWITGTPANVTWDVAGTNTGAVNTSNVNILLSIDGGLTFPIVLAENTPNDGSENISVPAIAELNCRVKVEAVGNIYYAMNSKDFVINYTTVEVCNTYSSTDTPIEIPDGPDINDTQGPAVFSFITIPDTSSTIKDLNITVDVTHPWLSNIVLQLQHPDDTTYMNLFARDCAREDGIDVVFDDDGVVLSCIGDGSIFTGTVKPTSSSLSIFNDLATNGEWALASVDFRAGNTGTINSWAIEVCYVEVSSVLSVDEHTFNKFNVYPNPSSGTLNVSLLSNSIEDVEIYLYDITGRMINSKKFGLVNTNFNEQFNYGSISDGIYILKVVQGTKTITKRIAVN